VQLTVLHRPMRDATWKRMFAVLRRVRSPPVGTKVVTGYWFHEPAGRSQEAARRRKALAPATWSWHSRSTVVQRSDRDLTSTSPLLRVHSWSYTPILIHRGVLPSSCAFPSPPIAFSGCTTIAAQRQGQDASTSYLRIPRPARTGYQPGMLHGGCRCQV